MSTSTAVAVPGWGQTKEHLRPFRDALYEHHDAVIDICYRQAMDDPHGLADALEGSTLYTVSAGLVASEIAIKATGQWPESVTAIAAPTEKRWPLGRAELVAKSFIKTVAMHLPDVIQTEPVFNSKRTTPNYKPLLKYDIGAGQELAREWMHPIRLIRELGKIAEHNCVRFAEQAREHGVPVTFGIMSHDAYFHWTTRDQEHAHQLGAKTVHMVGRHDDAMFRPAAILSALRQRSTESPEQSTEQAWNQAPLGLLLPPMGSSPDQQ